MADWPSTLPPLRLPLSTQVQDSVLRTQMDAGPGKARRRFTAVTRNYSVPMRMTGAQYETLDSFYASNIEFDMADPLTGDTEVFRFLSPPGATVVVGNSNPDKRIIDVELQIEKLP